MRFDQNTEIVNSVSADKRYKKYREEKLLTEWIELG